MRYSSDSLDTGYNNWRDAMERGQTPTVFLDGKEQKKCDMADTDLGVVRRMKLDENGDPVMNGDEIAVEIVTGKVRIELRRTCTKCRGRGYVFAQEPTMIDVQIHGEPMSKKLRGITEGDSCAECAGFGYVVDQSYGADR